MPIITSIKLQRKGKRFNIYLDGKFAFAVSAVALAKADLRIDQEISEKDIERLRNKDLKEKLHNKSLNFLSYRPRSEKEIRDYLNKKIASQKAQKFAESTEKVVEEIITKLKDQDLIDDRVFTDWWIEQRSRFRPKGRRVLWLELLRKGIKKEIIETFLVSEEKEFDLARKAAKKKVKSYKDLEPMEFRQKMVAFLSRRGFNWEVIKKVLEEIKKKS